MDDECVGVRHVETQLHDGGRHENVDVAIGERRHGLLELILAHPAVRDTEAGLGHRLLQDVRDRMGDSASLAVLSHDEILYLVHISTNRMIRVAAGYGTRFPAYPTSLGRVLLAYQPPERIEAYLDRVELRKLTEKTVTSRSRLETILRRCRREGYTSIQDELDYGIVSVAVPVRSGSGDVVAAINCSTATSRVDPGEMLVTRLPVLQRAAREIEIELQHYPVLVNSILAAAQA